MILCAFMFANVFVVEATTNIHADPGAVSDISFDQVSFYFDGERSYNDTEWGSVTITFTGQDLIMYFNLAVNGAWEIQNMPVLSGFGVGVVQNMTYYFDLGTPRGTVVTSLNYDYEFASYVLDTMPSGSDTAHVGKDYVVLWAEPGGLMPDLAAPQPLTGGQVSESAKHDYKVFPNQECGPKEGTPAAVSNGLMGLNIIYNLGMKNDQISIDAMKEALGFPALLHRAWCQELKQAFRHDGFCFVDLVPDRDVARALSEIKDPRRQIIEVEERWRDEKGVTTGHTLHLLGITKLMNGNYSLDVADDRVQGDDHKGTDRIRTIIYDPVSGKGEERGLITGIEGHYSIPW